jgi:predicted lipoprotein with Yx(FWY)xxD motif
MRTTPRLLLSVAVPIALIVGACSDGGASTAPSAAPSAAASVAPSAAPSEAPGAATIALADNALGQILVDAEGRSLYGFTVDTDGVSACYAECEDAWPPLLSTGADTVGEGLDAALLTTVARTDGTQQLKYGDWPLYYFAADAAAGDVNGQGVNDVWFVIGADGALIGMPAAAAATVALAENALGQILVDAEGRTLYGFTVDADGVSACYDDCAAAWPALLSTGADTAGDGLDGAMLTTVDRTDGSSQLKYGDWPLYHFSGDAAAGETNGQGLNDVWFVIGADGALIGAS